MQNNGKDRLAGQNLTLRLHISEEELTIKAGDQLFSQETNDTEEDDVPMEGTLSPMDKSYKLTIHHGRASVGTTGVQSQ